MDNTSVPLVQDESFWVTFAKEVAFEPIQEVGDDNAFAGLPIVGVVECANGTVQHVGQNFDTFRIAEVVVTRDDGHGIVI